MALVIDTRRHDEARACVPAEVDGDKFSVPALPGTFLGRPRLQHALSAAAIAPLTVVVGPIGAGKTTLLASFARSRPCGTTAWCTLDARDEDPLVFGTSVLQAILTARASAGTDQLAAVRASSPDPLDQAIGLAVHSPGLVLVLDNVESIYTRAGRATLQQLVQMTPQGLPTVLVTRHDPALQHQTFRGIRRVTLRAADLAFTASESMALFDLFGIAVPADDVATLSAWTEGSAALLKLAALHISAGRTQEPLLTEARLGDRTVIDYLFNEVLAQQPADLRDFILRTAVVDVLGCDLAEAIVDSGHAANDLDRAARQELFFTPVGGAQGWYRHHSLIADLLRATLQHELPCEVPVLHARAAHWFEAAGRLDDAMRHAAAAREWDLVARMVTEAWIAPTLERAATPARTAAYRLPDAVCGRDATRALAVAIQHLVRGEHDEASSWMTVAANCPDNDDDGRSARRSFVAALIRLVLACEGTNSARAIDDAVDLLEPQAEVGCDSPEERMMVARLALLARAEARLHDGDLDAMPDLLERVIAYGPSTNRDAMNANATTLLALASALGGRLRNAVMLCDELGESSANMATTDPRGIRSLTLAVCAYHADDLPAARAALAEARLNLGPGVCRDVVAVALAARIAMSTGDKGAAKRQLANIAGGCDSLLTVLDEALGLVEPARRRDRKAGMARVGPVHPYALARSHLAEASERAAMHDFPGAESECERALALIDRHGYRRAFVDSGLAVREVLVDYVAGVRPFRMLATQLLERMRTDGAASSAEAVERLTDRELTVLRYLPTMMSNSEIAAEMYFSVNTVKTHLKSIYRKLEVTRRREAVERARVLSLI
jgi:LuxR family maltose regulon positive regulatory protein